MTNSSYLDESHSLDMFVSRERSESDPEDPMTLVSRLDRKRPHIRSILAEAEDIRHHRGLG